MDLERTLAEIEEAHKAMLDAAAASGAAPENQKLAEDISNARWDFLWLLCDRAPLLIAALRAKVTELAFAKSAIDPKATADQRMSLGREWEKAMAEFKALAEGE